MFYIEMLNTKEYFLGTILFSTESEKHFDDITFYKAIWSYEEETFMRNITYSLQYGSAIALKI